ncbi:MAG TPA: hypothetical protein DEB25_05660 [Desulfobulbaceae bacterium]|nr:hypothetical protein [Desulfobulbaceae bacterium]
MSSCSIDKEKLLENWGMAIDLDDGVKENYLKFGTALKKIPDQDAKGDSNTPPFSSCAEAISA